MSTGGILGLGAIAGVTIFIGLPVGRMRGLSTQVRTLLNAVAIGILLFLVWDVLTAAVDPIENRLGMLTTPADHPGTTESWWGFLGHAGLLAAGLGVGLLSLVYYDRLLPKRRSLGQASAGASGAASIGPGAAAIEEFTKRSASQSPARRLAFTIAIGIGLHNFAEGLAIGQSASAGDISLAVLLVIGFALHNATEGFGIVGPLAGEAERPSWGLLALLGLIGGGPTFVGTAVGQAMHSDAVSVAFLALAAGSILYVVIQLVGVALRAGHKEMLYWGVFVGLVLGFATDFVVSAAGV
ncbi:MAG: zinc transporter, family [Pseudonocardiales bacterium]|jgi:ZIP family zinc transporter|nr:zinc transporter, family [Pseudonocardiales bacterium]